LYKIKILPKVFYKNCYDIFSKKNEDFDYFKNLGWSKKQFKLQLSKEINYSFALFKDNIMMGFVIGDLITIEKYVEYEILLIYVIPNVRRLGYATKLLKKITILLKKNTLKKIYIEVSENNKGAIRLYKKNDFIQVGLRKNYYKINDEQFNAILLEKKTDD
tara:strand:- start:556 stop:1038 length:483 start_codon:yes stop_codon:yes gene_type:complete